MVREAVDDNVDAIHNRLPKPLRASRRRVWLVGRWARRLGVPAAIILTLSGGQGRFAAVPDEPRVAPPAPPAAPVKETPPPDPAALAQRFPPGVLALTVRRIVIDAGHGGENLGTSSATGLHEKEVTLDIAGRLRQLVVAGGFEAVMTREKDQTVSLQQRATVANDRRGDIFVSIHLNSLEPKSARGIETYYLGPTSAPDVDALAARENQDSGYSLADLRTLLDEIFTDARRAESKRL